MDKLIPNSSKDNTPQDQLNGLAKIETVSKDNFQTLIQGKPNETPFEEKERLKIIIQKLSNTETKAFLYNLIVKQKELIFKDHKAVCVLDAILKTVSNNEFIGESALKFYLKESGNLEFVGEPYLKDIYTAIPETENAKEAKGFSGAVGKKLTGQSQEVLETEKVNEDIKNKIEFLPDKIPLEDLKTKWLLINFIEAGNFTLFAGQAGSGKTTGAIHLTVLNAKGEPFYRNGTEDGPKGDGRHSLYICTERKKSHARAKVLACGGDPKYLKIVTKIGGKIPNLSNEKHLEYILNLILSGDFAFVIFDPIVDLELNNQNDNAAVRKKMTYILDKIEHLDTALLGIMHLKKDRRGTDDLGSVRGASEWGNVASSVLITKELKDGSGYVIQKIKVNESSTGNKGALKYNIENININSHSNKGVEINKGGLKGPFEYIDKAKRDLDKDCVKEFEFQGETHVDKIKVIIADMEADGKELNTSVIKKKAIARDVSTYYLKNTLKWNDFGYKAVGKGQGKDFRRILEKLS